MGTTYYVSQVDGNDSYNGLYDHWISGSNGPWLTIGKADDLAGDQSDNKALFRRGGTWREAWTLACYGTSGQPFTTGAYGTGDRPKIYGSIQITGWADQGGNVWRASCSTEPTVVWFINASDGKTKWGVNDVTPDAEYDWYWAANYLYCYAATDPDARYTSVEAAVRTDGVYIGNRVGITVQDLEVAYVSETAIKNAVDGTYAKIDGCTIHHAGPMNGSASNCISVRGSHSTISNNLIYEGGTHGIYVTGGASGKTTTDVTVERNEVYNCYHTGIDIMGPNIGGTVNYIYVLRNLVYTTDDYAAGGVYDMDGIQPSGNAASTLSYVTVAYNIVLFMSGGGITALDYCDHLYFYNNVVYGDNPSATSENVRFYLFTAVAANLTNCVVKNNISVQDNLLLPAFKVSFESCVTECDYNCWYNTGGGIQRYVTIGATNYHYDDFAAYAAATTAWRGGSSTSHDVWGDPKFVNAGGTTPADYKLAFDSPCINAGVDVGLTEDYWGTSIPQGSGYDIGAREYYSWSVMPLLRGGRRLREQRILGIKTGVPTYIPPELTIRGFKLVFYNTSQAKVGELGADVQFGKLSEIDFELMDLGCGAFSFVLDSLPTFPITYRTRVDVHPYFDAAPWFSGFVQTIPKPGQKPPFRYIGFGFFAQLDWVTVTEAYVSQELSVIIKDIIENTVAPNTQIAYNASKIETTSYTATSITFDHVRAKDAIEQLANLVAGYEYGVDNSREFYFRAKDTGVNYYQWAGKQFQEVDLEEDPLAVRNKLYVKSGKIQTDGSNLVGTVSDSGSISTYGLREEVVTAPDVLNSADALEWAAQILAEKKNPKTKGKVANVIVDQTKTKIEASGKIRITAHEGTAYELPIDRVLYHISKDGILAEIDCEQNPHPLEELLTGEIKTSDDEQRLSDKRTKELYDLVAPLVAEALKSGAMSVTADVANSTQAMANVTGLSFPVEANKAYTFDFTLKVGSTAVACGIWYQFTGPASPTSFWFNLRYWTAGPAFAWEEITAFSTPTSATDQAVQVKLARIRGVLLNGANAGTVQLQFRCEAAGQTVTVYKGSSGAWRKLD